MPTGSTPMEGVERMNTVMVNLNQQAGFMPWMYIVVETVTIVEDLVTLQDTVEREKIGGE